MMKIAVAGTGYVGLSNAVLLAQHNEVIALDIIQEKVDLINAKRSPIKDPEVEEYLREKSLSLVATTDSTLAYRDADFVIISTPTNYDPEKNYFDTSSVEAVIADVLSVTIIVRVLLRVFDRMTGLNPVQVESSSSSIRGGKGEALPGGQRSATLHQDKSSIPNTTHYDRSMVRRFCQRVQS